MKHTHKLKSLLNAEMHSTRKFLNREVNGNQLILEDSEFKIYFINRSLYRMSVHLFINPKVTYNY